jgi:hypothetical protein
MAAMVIQDATFAARAPGPRSESDPLAAGVLPVNWPCPVPGPESQSACPGPSELSGLLSLSEHPAVTVTVISGHAPALAALRGPGHRRCSGPGGASTCRDCHVRVILGFPGLPLPGFLAQLTAC